MVYRSLILSDKYQLDYLEVDQTNRSISRGYDFYVFNYHHSTMGWLDTKCVRELPGLKATVVLETLTNDPFVLCPADDFDVYLALDPTMHVTDKRVYAMPRPLEVPAGTRPYQESPIPVIGTFGLATPGKGFELIVDAVNKEFEEAVVRINIAPGTHTDASAWGLYRRDYAGYLIELCEKVAKQGVQVIVTRDYMTKEGLIEWCGQNTLNCFLYNRNQPGLAATTDQAISSGRPLAVSTNETFRHIHRYLAPYPFQSLKQSIATSQSAVLRMQSEWAPIYFATKFEEALADFGLLCDREPDQVQPRRPENSVDSRPFVLETLNKQVEADAVAQEVKRNSVRVALLTVRSKLRLRTRIRQMLTALLPAAESTGAQLAPAPVQFESDQAEVRSPQVHIPISGPSREDTILIISHRERRCGIHQYGINITEALQKSSRYLFPYVECDNEEQLHRAILLTNPSAVIYNYYPLTMPWLTPEITRRRKVLQLGVMHEVTQQDADNATREMFDYHLCPDPTLIENNPYVLKTRRLILPYLNYELLPDIVTIGSFGFGFADKGFERLINVVQEEFDEARIVLNLPFNDIVGEDFQRNALARIKEYGQRVSKPGIDVVITHEFFSKRRLLDFLGGNTINAFFYDTPKHRGISSTIEYALAVQRPIAITKSGMFRHVSSVSPSICIEDSSLKKIIENGIAPLVPFYNEWSEANFVLDCERIMDKVLGKGKSKSAPSRA